MEFISNLMSEKAMAPHSSTLAWKIPWTEQPGRLRSMGWLRVRRDWATSLSLFTFMHWRMKWQPTPVFLPGESQGWGSLVGCLPSTGLHRVGHDWSNAAAAAAAATLYTKQSGEFSNPALKGDSSSSTPLPTGADWWGGRSHAAEPDRPWAPCKPLGCLLQPPSRAWAPH